MEKYCVTAANHSNPDNHIASSFQVFLYLPVDDEWKRLPPQTLMDIARLISDGNEVVSGKFTGTGVRADGAPLELELRIAKNGTKYNVSQMPGF